MLPGPVVPGSCLASFHFLRAIHPIRPVLICQVSDCLLVIYLAKTFCRRIWASPGAKKTARLSNYRKLGWKMPFIMMHVEIWCLMYRVRPLNLSFCFFAFKCCVSRLSVDQIKLLTCPKVISPLFSPQIYPQRAKKRNIWSEKNTNLNLTDGLYWCIRLEASRMEIKVQSLKNICQCLQFICSKDLI